MMDSVQSYDHFYDRACAPVLRFAVLPKRCALTGKLIWMKNGYFFVRYITGPGEPVVEFRWHDVQAHIFWQLKR